MTYVQALTSEPVINIKALAARFIFALLRAKINGKPK
jgi:hypothetical protein